MAWPTVVIDTTNMDATGDNPGNARADIKQMADNVNAIKDSKGAASGIAPLDAGSKVPTSNLPTIPANQGGTGHTAFTVGDVFYANTTTTLAKLAAGASGTVLTSNGAGTAPSYQTAGGVPSGTRMSFNQTTAPTGWTKDTTAALNDSIMRIVTGSVSSGGSNAFSAFNGQTSVGATTLTVGQIPSHTHSIITSSQASPGGYDTGDVLSSTSSIWNSGFPTARSGTLSSTGGGGSHVHSLTTSIKYNDFIIAQKD